ncbi:MAG: DUF438 domain-containing protein [Thermoleophilia bacterium]
MEIGPKTKIHELLSQYPYLLDFLADYHSEFQKLRNPVLRATLARVASLETASEMADLPISKLITDIKTEIDRREGRASAEAGVGATSAEPGQEGPIGAHRRQEILKGIIRDLHAGAPKEEIKNRFAELIQEVEPGEIAAMEQALIAEGMPADEIQSLCDVHVSVFKDSLDTAVTMPEDLPAGHPVDTFLKENRLAADATASLHCRLDELAAAEGAAQTAVVQAIAAELESLMQIDKHYLRKENQLFPVLEDHGITGPSQVMWGIHDEIRSGLKQARSAAAEGDADRLKELIPALLQQIEDMIYKEEKILLPVSLERFSDAEWARVREGEEEIGYAWLRPEDVPQPAPSGRTDEARLTRLGAAMGGPATGEAAMGEASTGGAATGNLPLTTGAVPLDRIDLLLRNLPFDLTYVDENDEVRYYSEGDRVFPRSPGVIGRKVENCHPPKSVEVVKRIVEEFRNGRRDKAEFWIQLHERFIHIRYFAVRDDSGTYRGVLEVVQDLTELRRLEGERRLLDW